MTVTDVALSEDKVALPVLPLVLPLGLPLVVLPLSLVVLNRGSTAVVELATGVADVVSDKVELRSGTTTVVYVEWVAVTVTKLSVSSDVVVLGLALLVVNKGSTAVVSDVEGAELVPFTGRADVAGLVEFVVDG